MWGVLLLGLAIFLLVGCVFGKREPAHFPPGPLALPLVGNIFNIPVKQPHLYLTQVRIDIVGVGGWGSRQCTDFV